jgi:hypothetical protein
MFSLLSESTPCSLSVFSINAFFADDILSTNYVMTSCLIKKSVYVITVVCCFPL